MEREGERERERERYRNREISKHPKQATVQTMRLQALRASCRVSLSSGFPTYWLFRLHALFSVFRTFVLQLRLGAERMGWMELLGLVSDQPRRKHSSGANLVPAIAEMSSGCIEFRQFSTQSPTPHEHPKPQIAQESAPTDR